MTTDASSGQVTVGIVGAGAMGRGIAQVTVTGGMDAVLYDADADAARNAADFIASMLARQVDKERMSAEDRDAALARLTVADNLDAMAGCDLVVEAIVENIAVKQEVFQGLEKVVSDNAIIASNTSSLRIASIASSCRKRDRIAGLHFFNPVPIMKLVEVIAAPETAPNVVDTLTAIGKRMGRVPVVVKDSPGFLVNLGGSAYTTEGLRIVSEGSATPAQVDAVMRDAGGFRMGPFELMDLTGIDVNFPVRMIIYNGYFQDRRLTTSPLHESMCQSGRLGRKTGGGFYQYDADGKMVAENADADTSTAVADSVFVADGSQKLKDLMAEAGATVIDADDGTSPILCAPLGEDCTAVAARLGVDHTRLVAVDLSGNIAKRLTIMQAPGADAGIGSAVAARLAQTGAAVTAIKDSPGFIAQRIRAMVANLGCEMAQIGVATPDDIDTAMTLGLNYPQGPLEMAAEMGVRDTLEILTNLQAITGDDRYRPSQWLRRRALLDLAIHTPD
jgi:3-hydroxybutyryl-CoA dehydrogenase